MPIYKSLINKLALFDDEIPRQDYSLIDQRSDLFKGSAVARERITGLLKRISQVSEETSETLSS